jgi:hypothetical protein
LLPDVRFQRCSMRRTRPLFRCSWRADLQQLPPDSWLVDDDQQLLSN